MKPIALLSLLFSVSAFAAGPANLKHVTLEARKGVTAVEEALSKRNFFHPNTASICFELGALEYSLRHDLPRAAKETSLTPQAQVKLDDVLKSEAELPAFCKGKRDAKALAALLGRVRDQVNSLREEL